MGSVIMRSLKDFLILRMTRIGFAGPTDLSRHAGLEPQTYHRLVKVPDKTSKPTRERFAAALQFGSWDDLEDAWKSDDALRGLPLAHPPRRERPARFAGPPVRPSPGNVIEGNVDPLSEQASFEIPEFDLSVAAGRWVEVAEIAEVYGGREIDHGRFRIRIRGDSMEPKYHDGVWVEFRCLRAGRDVVEIENAYYVQRSDGMATFKIVAEMNDEFIVLRALNQEMYPEPMPVMRSEIVRMAKAEWLLSRA